MSSNNSLTAQKTSNESSMHSSSNMQHENLYKPFDLVLKLNRAGDNRVYLKYFKNKRDENTQFDNGFYPRRGEEVSRPRETPTSYC